MIDHGYRLHGHCSGCGKHRVLSLPDLAERLGRDFVPSDHGGRLPLRCDCGSRGIAISVEPRH